jgi:endonuclease/exonuclease/phosphatase family metal-dependent hydrolase
MIRVATYNMYCRPRFSFYDNQLIRARLLSGEILRLEETQGKKIDVLCLQEIVDNKVHKILKKELYKIGFVFKTKRLDTTWRMNGGIIIYSRYPIIKETSIVFKLEDSYIWNAPASKGAICIKVMKNKEYYNIVNTHLDSFNANFRKRQMEHMRDWIDEKMLPDTEPIIITGDFNIDFHSEEKKNIDEVFDYKYAENIGFLKHSITQKNDWVKRRITSKSDPDKKDELLDFFIYDSEEVKKAEMQIIVLQHEQEANDICCSTPFFANIYNPNKNLVVRDMSDHYMVICEFN